MIITNQRLTVLILEGSVIPMQREAVRGPGIRIPQTARNVNRSIKGKVLECLSFLAR